MTDRPLCEILLLRRRVAAVCVVSTRFPRSFVYRACIDLRYFENGILIGRDALSRTRGAGNTMAGIHAGNLESRAGAAAPTISPTCASTMRDPHVHERLPSPTCDQRLGLLRYTLKLVRNL